MGIEMRAKRGAPFRKMLLTLALGVGRHAIMVCANGYHHHHHLSSGGPRGHGGAPAPGPLGHVKEDGLGGGDRAGAAWGVRAMYDLMVLCGEKGWSVRIYVHEITKPYHRLYRGEYQPK